MDQGLCPGAQGETGWSVERASSGEECPGDLDVPLSHQQGPRGELGSRLNSQERQGSSCRLGVSPRSPGEVPALRDSSPVPGWGRPRSGGGVGDTCADWREGRPCGLGAGAKAAAGAEADPG